MIAYKGDGIPRLPGKRATTGATGRAVRRASSDAGPYHRAGVDPRAKLRGRALYALAQHHYVRGGLRDVLEPAQQALSIAREHGDDEWIVYCLDKLAISFAWLGEAEPARECCAEELAVARATGQPRLLGFALTARGGVCRAQGDYRGAVDAYEQALALFDATHDLHNRHNTLVNIARLRCNRRAHRANDTLASAIRLVGEMGTMTEAISRSRSRRGSLQRAATGTPQR
jgi:tetratricopeptide (TPR) repeat protein